MDLSRFIPNFNRDKGLSEEELDEQDAAYAKRRYQAGRLGPRPVRYATNGQMRRQAAREAASDRRKANKRYRKAWRAAELRTHGLHRKIEIVNGTRTPKYAGEREHAVEVIFDQFGSVKAAVDHFNQEVMAS